MAKIQNKEKKVPIGSILNDKDYLTNLLVLLKDMEKNMVVSLTEASNETLYKEEYKIFEGMANLQREAYELMFKKGWYPLESADATKIKSTYNKLNTEYNDLFKKV